MHLLSATPGQIDDGSEAIDLGQTPADIIYISAADTECYLIALFKFEKQNGNRLKWLKMASLIQLYKMAQ